MRTFARLEVPGRFTAAPGAAAASSLANGCSSNSNDDATATIQTTAMLARPSVKAVEHIEETRQTAYNGTLEEILL